MSLFVRCRRCHFIREKRQMEAKLQNRKKKGKAKVTISSLILSEYEKRRKKLSRHEKAISTDYILIARHLCFQPSVSSSFSPSHAKVPNDRRKPLFFNRWKKGGKIIIPLKICTVKVEHENYTQLYTNSYLFIF